MSSVLPPLQMGPLQKSHQNSSVGFYVHQQASLSSMHNPSVMNSASISKNRRALPESQQLVSLPELHDQFSSLKGKHARDPVDQRYDSNCKQILTLLRFTNPDCEKDSILRRMAEDVDGLKKENASLEKQVKVLTAKERELELENTLLRTTITHLSKKILKQEVE